jgi:hypothetical protein
MTRAGDRRTTMADMSDDDIEIGPIDYVLVEFPGNKMTGEGMPLLVDLVDRGIIRILDFALLTKDADGNVAGLELSSVGGEVDLTVFEGASSGILGDDDLAEAGVALEANSTAVLIVYENTWAGPFAAALRRGGAQLVATGRIPINAIIQSLEEIDGDVVDLSKSESTTSV